MLKFATFILLFFLSIAQANSFVETDTCVFDALAITSQKGNLYRVDHETSAVKFGVNSAAMRVEGKFQEFRGGILLTKEGQGIAYSVMVIRSDTLDTNSAFVKPILKGEQFFDVENYPEIVFINRDFRWIDNNTATIGGELTIRGITHPVVFNVKIRDIENDRIQFVGVTKINRADYGMDALSSVVDDDVDLILSVEAAKYR